MNYKLYNGDCLDELKNIPDNSIESVVTDPPYELSFMQKNWDSTGIAYSVDLWKEVLRVLKPGGHLLSFGGSRTYHRMACAIEDAGFEIRDQIQWITGQGFPKNHNISKAIDRAAGAEREVVGFNATAHAKRNQRRIMNGDKVFDGGFNDTDNGATITAPATDAAKEWEGWGTALKPSHEPIVLARKPLIGTVAENVQKWGTGGLNIDGCRISVDSSDDIHAKNPHTVNKGSNEIYGAFKKDGSCPSYNPSLGRWPANIILDGSDEVVSLFPDTTTSSDKRGQCNGKRPGGFGNVGNPNGSGEPNSMQYPDTGSAARYFYCPKASKKDRDEGMQTPEQQIHTFQTGNGASGKPSSISKDRDTQYRNNHPTVKPTELMRYLCRLITRKGGTVLDPFMGSGTTGKAAMLEGMNFIGIEREKEYLEIAEQRISHAQQKLTQHSGLARFYEEIE